MRETLAILYTNEKEVSSFCQSPVAWFLRNGIEDEELLGSTTYSEIKEKVHRLVLGPAYCIVCNNLVRRMMPGFRKGFMKTCSTECENKFKSQRQTGNGNTVHRQSSATRKISAEKQSATLKQKILNGDFTPRSENYRRSPVRRMVKDGREVIIRSLWEFVYWSYHPHLQYEAIRVEYYDSKTKKHRIYIPDFYEEKSNTIIEIKPKKYQYTLVDKIPAIQRLGYNIKIVDEDYFAYLDIDQTLQFVDIYNLNEPIKSKEDIKWLIRRSRKSHPSSIQPMCSTSMSKTTTTTLLKD